MTTPADSPTPPPPPERAPRRLERSSTDRMIAGVAGGIGRYFGIDSTLVRMAFVGLALLGGTGFVVYAAALVLVPLDDADARPPATLRDRAVAAAIVIGCIIGALWVGTFGFGFGALLFPVAFLALAGLGVWWLVSGERPSGGAGDVAKRAAKGAGLLVACALLAIASFFVSALGGGTIVAALVIAAGAALIAGAFVGTARWLILPGLAIALPLAFVSAAGIDLDGGFGERLERPATLAELQQEYRIGAGQLVIDLRELKLSPGDHPLSVGVGAGHALVIVPDDVCVASKASVGMGAVAVFDRESGGIDFGWNDGRRAPEGTPRLVIDGEIGLGMLEVAHRDYGRERPHGPGWRWEHRSQERNAACATSTASAPRRAGG